MRILQICSARKIGGGERHVADLSNSLFARGHQIFLSLRPNSALTNELKEIPAENLLFSPMRNALDFFSARQIAGFIGKKKIEIIHAHLARDYSLAALASRISGKPFVLTRHVLFPLKKLNRFALKRVSGVIAVSKSVADALEKQNVFAPEKIATIYNGIDTKFFSPSERKPQTPFRVGTSGEISELKGVDVFIQAAEIVLKKQPETEFLIAGADKSKNGENLLKTRELISRLNLENRVRLLGWQRDVRSFLESLDLFVSASRFDAFGLSLAEAMSTGIATLATETEGAKEIILNNQSGKLVAVNDGQSLANAILELLENDEERNRLAAAGRERIVNNFSLEKMTMETEAFYRRILTENRA